jgi:hypothetical protein
MVVNFRARGISRGARKLARTPTIIKKKKKKKKNIILKRIMGLVEVYITNILYEFKKKTHITRRLIAIIS